MNILIAIMSEMFASIWQIFLKKSLSYKINLWNNDFLWQILPLVLFLLFYFFVWFSFDTTIDFSFKSMFFVGLSFIIFTIWVYFRSKIMKIEKVSFLLPYTNLERVLTIIFSFFIFFDVSLVTFLISLFTMIVITLWTLDFKKLTFSKNILVFCFSQLLFTIWNLVMWYTLLEAIKWWLWVSSFSFITTYLIIWTILYLIPFLTFKWYKELKDAWKDFYISRWISGFFAWFSWFLSMIIISNLWLSMSILLSFIWIFTTLVFAFFILKEKIVFKDVLLSVIVLSLISIWFYFN